MNENQPSSLRRTLCFCGLSLWVQRIIPTFLFETSLIKGGRVFVRSWIDIDTASLIGTIPKYSEAAGEREEPPAIAFDNRESRILAAFVAAWGRFTQSDFCVLSVL